MVEGKLFRKRDKVTKSCDPTVSEHQSMAVYREFPLGAVRTDGWFERIGQGIGSFRALCEIVGERFFAFSMITGARITALTVDRRNIDSTVVGFLVGAEGDDSHPDVQSLPLPDFRRRLVAALLTKGLPVPPPERDTDLEALQLHIGVRYLLLAPLYGYILLTLVVEDERSTLRMLVDGVETTCELEQFQQRLRTHVRDELDRSMTSQRSTIDLAYVAEAEKAMLEQDWTRVTDLLGTWPAPLAIFLRTPEGQMIAPETSALIARGLGILGTAWVCMGDIERAEEVFRLGVQYGQDGSVSADIFAQFGGSLLSDGRPGEAIGLLRRALALGAQPKLIFPMLAKAYCQRRRYVAARGCLLAALQEGVLKSELLEEIRVVRGALGAAASKLPNRLPDDDALAS